MHSRTAYDHNIAKKQPKGLKKYAAYADIPSEISETPEMQQEPKEMGIDFERECQRNFQTSTY